MPEIKIVPWEEKYAGAYISLALEWLEKYVRVEPADLAIIHHPRENVLNGGGNIFFALLAGEAVGTVSMLKQSETEFELAKLAVTEKCKGMKISGQLMAAALAFAKEQGAEKVVLYTNKTLLPAIGLYKKCGFVEIPMGNNKYEEADMKMELAL